MNDFKGVGELTVTMVKSGPLKTIDLFAGIGGIRLGFERASGFENAYSNEIDKFCATTYEKNFGETPIGDITKVNAKDLPDFDVLLAGFPCQAFSIAGQKKGFSDTRGTLFFDVARIIKEKKPRAFLLENVKNLEKHDKGKTFGVIKNVLESDLKYKVFHKVLNAKNFGVPQNRERVFIVGFRNDVDVNGYAIPEKKDNGKTLKDILEKNVPLRYFITKKRLQGMERHKERHKSKGNGFGYVAHDKTDIASALVVGGMGRERNLVRDLESFNKIDDQDKSRFNQGGIRYLTERECARLQGYPETFEIPVSKTQAYRQFSNSVAVPVIEEIAKSIKKVLEKN